MKKITGFSSFKVDDVRYEWNDTFSEYWSSNGNPRVLQDNDVAVLYLDQLPLMVGEPVSVGFAYKNIIDKSFSGRTEDERLKYLSELKRSLNIKEFIDTISVRWIESLQETVLTSV